MKNIVIILSVLLSTISLNLTAQNSDFQWVEKTVKNYMNGLVGGNPEMIKMAFHKDATMKMIGEKGYESYNAIEALTTDLKASPEATTTTRIVSINITGNSATAQLEIQLAELTYIDFMQILKIDGDWKIVSKIFYTRYHN